MPSRAPGSLSQSARSAAVIRQRACIAAEMIPLLAEEARARQLEPLKKGAESPSSPIGHNGSGRPREIAAKALDVGSSNVQRAQIAKRDNPEGFEKAKRGEMTVNAAAEGHTEQPKVDGRSSPRGESGVVKAFVRLLRADYPLTVWANWTLDMFHS